MSMDGRPAVFKTVCGALLRRPGWVRFPSIPAKFRADDSQHDSHTDGRPWLVAPGCGRYGAVHLANRRPAEGLAWSRIGLGYTTAYSYLSQGGFLVRQRH